LASSFQNAAVLVRVLSCANASLRYGCIGSFAPFSQCPRGYPCDELTTKSFRNITHPDDLAASDVLFEQQRKRKINRYEADRRYLSKDGTIGWVRVTVSCVRESDKSINYFVTVVEDVSARKRAEGELLKSEERFRSLVLHSPLPVLMLDDREKILAVSQSWLDETDYSRKELRRFEDWTIRAYGERFERSVGRCSPNHFDRSGAAAS
jgi:PAS domain S-box-containing protein